MKKWAFGCDFSISTSKQPSSPSSPAAHVLLELVLAQATPLGLAGGALVFRNPTRAMPDWFKAPEI